MRKLGCAPYPSHTNFFLIDVRGDATRLYEAMLYKGVIVRSMKAYGYPDFIRITVGTAAENQRFVSALASVCGIWAMGVCKRDRHHRRPLRGGQVHGIARVGRATAFHLPRHRGDVSSRGLSVPGKGYRSGEQRPIGAAR